MMEEMKWVAEVHLEGYKSFIVCDSFSSLATALEDDVFGSIELNSRNKLSFDSYEREGYILRDITIKFVQMTKKELEELKDFEGF